MGLFAKLFSSDSYKEPLTGIQFPKKLGDYTRDRITSSEVEPGYPGVSLAYNSAEAAITIYVREPDHEAPSTSEEYLVSSLAAVQELETRGTYSNVKIYEMSAEHERPGWRSALFTSSSSNRFIVSFLHCKVTANYLVKIRATTGDPKNEAVQSFVAKLQEKMDTEATRK